MSFPTPARTSGWNLQVRIASGLVVLAGLWLIVSPWVFGWGFRRGAAPNDVVIGIIIAALAAFRFVGDPTRVWPSWITAVLGVWTLISPWVYGFASESPGLEHDTIFLAIAIIVLSFWCSVAGLELDQRLHASYG